MTMKILLVHNFYQQPGGEDQVFSAEDALLQSHGHKVIRYTLHNNSVPDLTGLKLAKVTLWNQQSYRDLKSVIQGERPDLMHVHNTFPLISPSAYQAAQSERIPVVQTLHNYRLLCPNALFFRNGSTCEDCLGKRVPWPGILHACYRESRPATGVVALMLSAHRLLKTWDKNVDQYVVLTEFSRQKFIQGGLPKEKITVKPNFLETDHGIGSGEGHYAIFIGRLAPEKGIETLLQAWKQLNGKVPLKIFGDGPLSLRVRKAAENTEEIEYLGHQPRSELFQYLQHASFLIFPSLWYEGFPMTITEAFASGLPVIGSNVGSLTSLIQHGVNGRHFQPGNAQDLVRQVEWALDNPKEINQMRIAARKEFEEHFTREINYTLVMKIYERAISQHGRKLSPSKP